MPYEGWYLKRPKLFVVGVEGPSLKVSCQRGNTPVLVADNITACLGYVFGATGGEGFVVGYEFGIGKAPLGISAR